ncbi:MAG: cupin domain-containing protein [Candidatus Limnocylindrales bacterium]
MNSAVVQPRLWSLEDLRREMLDALEQGGHPQGRLVEGRIVAVLATPAAGSATELAFGFSAIPSGKRTEPHSHAAEEIAFVLSGSGTVQINDESFDVNGGSVLLTPSWSVHQTTVTGREPMLSLWVYAPAGSEGRWLPPSEPIRNGP